MKKILGLMAALVIVALLGSCSGLSAPADEYQNNPLSIFFRELQHAGYVVEFDEKSDTHSGVSLRVTAVTSDGLTSFISIAVDGDLPTGLVPNNSDFSAHDLVDDEDEVLLSQFDDGKGMMFASPNEISFASNNILDARLLDEQGNMWSFRVQNQLGGRGGVSTPVVRPSLRSPQLRENEDVLVFHGTELLDTATFSLEIELRGIDDVFVITGLEIPIAPVITRDLSSYNLEYDFWLASMRWLSVRHSQLDTIFTIEWEVHPGFDLHEFVSRHESIVFSWGDEWVSTFMYNPFVQDSRAEPVIIVGQFTLDTPLPVDQEIAVSLRERANGSTIAEFFTIPAYNA